MVDQRFHAGLQLLSGWKRNLAVRVLHRAGTDLLQLFQSLADDRHALAHLGQADPIARKGITLLLHRDLKVILLVATIGRGLADVIADADAPQHRSGTSQPDGLAGTDHSDAVEPGAVHRVVREHRLVLGQTLLE